MAVFDNVKGKLSGAGRSRTFGLNRAIREAEEQINELYGKIGYEVYLAYCDNPLPEISGLIDEVTALHSDIGEYKKQIQLQNRLNTCPQCHAKIHKRMAFCSSCGYKLITSEEIEPPLQPCFCSSCGSRISPDSVFCSSCGIKIN